jgi:hypothetical protein
MNLYYDTCLPTGENVADLTELLIQTHIFGQERRVCFLVVHFDILVLEEKRA